MLKVETAFGRIEAVFWQRATLWWDLPEIESYEERLLEKTGVEF
jgi:hypothetical protein